jgi:hypothetical protein
MRERHGCHLSHAGAGMRTMRELVGSVFPRESCVGSASLSVKLPMLVAPNLLEEMFIRIELARAEANSIANILPMGDGLVLAAEAVAGDGQDEAVAWPTASRRSRCYDS